jgi:hypothetical protein
VRNLRNLRNLSARLAAARRKKGSLFNKLPVVAEAERLRRLRRLRTQWRRTPRAASTRHSRAPGAPRAHRRRGACRPSVRGVSLTPPRSRR